MRFHFLRFSLVFFWLYLIPLISSGQALLDLDQSVDQNLNPGVFSEHPMDFPFPKFEENLSGSFIEARGLFLKKDFVNAEKSLSKIKPDKNSEENRLLFLFQGIVQYELQKYSLAEEFLKKYVEEKHRLLDVGHYYLGLVYFQEKKLSLARENFNKVRSLGSSDYLSNRTSYYQAKIDWEEEKFEEARSGFYKVRKKMRSSEFYPDILFSLMVLDGDLKKNDSDQCRWARELYKDHPTFKKISHWGLQLRKNKVAGQSIPCTDSVVQTKARLRRLQWSGASQRAFEELKQFGESKASDFDKTYMMSEYLINEGHVREALDKLLPFHEKQKKNFKYVMLVAKAASRAGEFQMAIGIYLKAFRTFTAGAAKTALYRAAFLSYQHQDYDGALKLFSQLKEKYPTSNLSTQANWFVPWLYYLKGQFVKSHELFEWAMEIPGRRSRKISRNQLKYWSAMSLLKMGKTIEAEVQFSEIARDSSMGYYSVASVQRLRDLSGGRPLTFVEGYNGIQVHENWVPIAEENRRSPASTSLEKDEMDIPPVVSTDLTSLPFQKDYQNLDDNPEEIFNQLSEPVFKDKIARAKDLSIIGQLTLSKWELYWIELQAKSPSHRKTLMFEYHRNGIFHRSVHMANRHFRPMRTHLGLHLGASLWRFVYPRAFESDVTKVSSQHKIPSEFVWSIMKAETNFRSDAVSPVGALGLMQVMPHTGRKVASLMGKGALEPHELIRPNVAISVGGRYLKRVMKKFDNKIPLAAASYNGGPHRVHAWLAQFGNLDMDEFIDHIPFVETRNYVKRVVRYFSTYRLLYSKDSRGAHWLSKEVNVHPEGDVPTKETWEEL